ncbi:hypothetical protein [Beijerinckia mobilis]|uniref:hypothetical protein n=1 Tax=Beijerinckia mobilis TaxID=231434 RepID=UPI000552EC96|nr:hypothetical protein [Beijerinckia mobilis]
MPPADDDIHGRLGFLEANIQSMRETVRLLSEARDQLIAINARLANLIQSIDIQTDAHTRLSARVDILEQRANNHRAIINTVTLIGAPVMGAVGWLASHLSPFRDWIK